MKVLAKISIILIILLNIFSTMCFADVIGPAPYGMSIEEHGAWRREQVTKVAEPDYIKLILIGVTIVIIIVVTILIILKIKKDKKNNNDKNSNK